MVHAVVGAQFGDEGKGKMVDYFAVQASMVIRYQGGGNAGHTIVNEHGKFALHLVPSGIFNPNTTCVLGAGVVIHPGNLVKELATLKKAGIAHDKLVISERAHLVMPYHIWQDEYEESLRAKQVGTTKQGIGPAYQDKVGRFGVQIGEMRNEKRFVERIEAAFNGKVKREPALAAMGTLAQMTEELMAARAVLLPYIQDTLPIVRAAIAAEEYVLLEGQLGIMRDMDWGIYPYVTSSNPVAGATSVGAGIPPTAIARVTGITKAYTTAVGAGPFPTLLDDEMGDYLQEKGQEFGATTGRKRTCGWLDIPSLKLGAWINGYTDLALMKLDVLSGLDQIGVCTAYSLDGALHETPMPAYDLERADPVYEYLPGWKEDIADCRTWESLPSAAQSFVQYVEAQVGVPIRYVSVGPDRQQTILRG